MGGVAAITAGCYSAADVRQLPALWDASFPAPYARLAGCIGDAYAGSLTVVPQVFPEDRRANVLLTMPAAGQVMGEFQIRQVDGTMSTVSFRSKPGINRDYGAQEAREIADRCARQG